MKPKESGGLGIGSLKSANHALLAKWAWKFKVEKSTIWRKSVVEEDCKVISELSLLNFNPCDKMKATIGKGNSVSFWLDNWVLDEPLFSIFPNLFKLEDQNKVEVVLCCEEINGSTMWKWKWLTPTMSRRELLSFMVVKVY